MREHSGVMRSRRSQIAAVRQVALTALREYPLPEGRLTFVDHGENTTFRHSSSSGDHLVRVHRPQRHGPEVDTAAAIASEIAWLRSIRTDTALEVPEPLFARDGSVSVRATASGQTRVCSVLRWMPGRIHENSPRPVHLRRLGAAMAALHNQADAWVPPRDFVRINWDHETFFGNRMVYGGIPAADCWTLLPASLRARFEALADEMAEVMGSADDVGLIHADLHLGNAVFEGTRVKLIDFDDCGTGPRLYEVAVALWELRLEPDYQAYLDALSSGYLANRALDLTRVDTYIALRQVAFALWYTGTAQVNPSFAARLDVVHDWSLKMLDAVDQP
jgi:Ser/Thr protein kinase RdoA (MazF antagonist)